MSEEYAVKLIREADDAVESNRIPDGIKDIISYGARCLNNDDVRLLLASHELGKSTAKHPMTENQKADLFELIQEYAYHVELANACTDEQCDCPVVDNHCAGSIVDYVNSLLTGKE